MKGSAFMTLREQYEQMEQNMLSPFATFASETKGRDHPDKPCDMRTAFQRDRDRIIHCKSFRRLMHKTQVFLSPEGDHYRTRLTHTLEVCQIARTVARALRLNEDLAEAISLGHDLGHTPFGHAGEAVFNSLCPEGFRHADQSVRVVEVIEREGLGLNLTLEVRDGIRCHSSGILAQTPEGKLVRFSDKIAYMNHDIEDAIRAGVMVEDDVPWEVRHGLGRTKSQRITTLVSSLVKHSDGANIQLSEAHQRLYDQLRGFLFESLYNNSDAKSEEGKAKDVICRLFEFFMEHPDKLPGEYGRIRNKEGNMRAVCDYISGMSDRYCVAVYENLFVPRSWSI